MPIAVKPPSGMHGSFLTNALGMFNTGKQTYSMLKGGSEKSGVPDWSSASGQLSDPSSGVNFFKGQNPYSSALGQSAPEDQFGALLRRQSSMDASRAGLLDAEFENAAAAAAGAGGYSGVTMAGGAADAAGGSSMWAALA